MKIQKLIDKKLIFACLDEVIRPEDSVIIFYVGIWPFIHQLNLKDKNVCRGFLRILENYIGNKRTMLFPSFTSKEFFSLNKFDVDLSLPKESGIIPTIALKSKKYYRTPQPLHSYLVKGPKTKEVKKLSLVTSWGRGSILQWLSKNNARICPIGIPWRIGCSYFHKFEEKYKVPWRYFKIFKGNMYKNKKFIKEIVEKKYSGPKNILFKYDYKPIEKMLINNNLTLSSSSKDLPMQSSLTSQIDTVCNEFFQKNPWELVKNSAKIKQWVKNDKNKEKRIKHY